MRFLTQQFLEFKCILMQPRQRLTHLTQRLLRQGQQLRLDKSLRPVQRIQQGQHRRKASLRRRICRVNIA